MISIDIIFLGAGELALVDAGIHIELSIAGLTNEQKGNKKKGENCWITYHRRIIPPFIRISLGIPVVQYEKDLYGMQLHDEICVNMTSLDEHTGGYRYDVIRVPGGWLYVTAEKTATFVPLNNEFI